ncbi:T-cell surface glycoprotein CD4-like [Echeneis naucrates]|uniref:T-cell surface glycoprotein CD4-like n=1 Tax=Echeneis naucrates TaxID=173247 RepID=UPI0011146895|nr:T-cell surface glycoprotein CD4-like [Echeneis naucrates]
MKNLVRSFILLIAVHVTALGANELMYAREGETVKITCPKPGKEKSWTMYWDIEDGHGGILLAWLNDFGGKGFEDLPDWETKLSISDNSLVIDKIQQANFGKFLCKNNVNKNKLTIEVRKLDVRMSPTAPLLAGESMSLSCSVDPKAEPRPDIQWLNPHNEEVAHRQGIVTKTVTVQDSGIWTCAVKHGEKIIQKVTMSVAVVDFSHDPVHRQYTSIHEPLRLCCAFHPRVSWEHVKARGLQEIYWQFRPKSSSGLTPPSETLCFLSLQEPLKWNNTGQRKGVKSIYEPKTKNFSVTIKDAKEDNRGEYTCTMKFEKNLFLNRTIHVELLQVIASPKSHLVSGQPLNLTCTTGYPLPSDVKLRWTPPEGLNRKFDQDSEQLIIEEVGSGYGGTWRCELWQGTTVLTSAVLKLQIDSKLNLRMLLIICSGAAIAVLILALVLFLYRRKHRKMRHLRHRLCQCKNPKPKGFYKT